MLSARRKQGMMPSVGVRFRMVCCEGSTGGDEMATMVVVVMVVL